MAGGQRKGSSALTKNSVTTLLWVSKTLSCDFLISRMDWRWR
jgi:hypothetical protein